MREKEKHQFVVLLIYAFIGWFLYVPWPGLNPQSWCIRTTLWPTELPGQGCKPSFAALCIYIIERYSAIKRNTLLIYVSMWVNFTNIMLRKRSRTQKKVYCMVSFIWSSRAIYSDSVRMVVILWQGAVSLERGHERTFWGDRYVFYLDLGSGYTQCVHMKKLLRRSLKSCIFHSLWISSQCIKHGKESLCYTCRPYALPHSDPST